MRRTIVHTLTSSAALVIVAMFCAAATAQDYDLVILNGQVMDPETKLDGVRNVGIKDGKIATITEDAITGTDTLDATGHVVTAGFIDTHTHSSDKFSVKMSMMDGVTTGMDLELGRLHIAAWYAREKGKWPMNCGQAGPEAVVHRPTIVRVPQWFGDRPYRSLGYCCEWHMLQARFAAMEEARGMQ